jgi:hypothetical protein
MPIACPHCAASNRDALNFCESCGKALPDPNARGPRIVSEKEFATSAVGRELQVEQLHRKARTVSTTLYVVAVLQFLAAAVVFGLSVTMRANADADAKRAMLVLSITTGVLGAIFLGLGIWSRRSPLGAAIVGLVLFVSFIAADAVMNPLSLLQGIVVKAIIIIALIRATQAGLKYRALKRELALTES